MCAEYLKNQKMHLAAPSASFDFISVVRQRHLRTAMVPSAN
jgi:hypothetical protein